LLHNQLNVIFKANKKRFLSATFEKYVPNILAHVHIDLLCGRRSRFYTGKQCWCVTLQQRAKNKSQFKNHTLGVCVPALQKLRVASEEGTTDFVAFTNAKFSVVPGHEFPNSGSLPPSLFSYR